MKISSLKIWKKIPKAIKTKKAILAPVVILILAFVLTRGGGDVKQIKTVQVQEKTLESEITASGEVKSRQETNLRFQTSGKLVALSVHQGDYVKRGQLVASLNSQELEKRLQRELNLYFKTRLDFEDVKDSQENKVITDTLKRIAQRSQADLDNSVINVELQDLAIKFSRLASPIDGYVVSEPNVFVQTFVLPTDIIVQVASLDKIQFVAQIDETEVGKLKIGQKATLTLDAFEDKSIETTVASIAPKAITTSTGATAFEVKFNLDSKDNLRLGMNGEAKIVTQEAQNALVVPLEAVFDEKYVWVKVNGDFQKREVAKSLESETEIQITAGITGGEEVVIADFDQIEKKSLLQKAFGRLKRLKWKQ